MAKVDWITWKTDPSEIINPDIVNDRFDELFQNYVNHMKPNIYDELKKEVVSGGLSQDAFNVYDYSPTNQLAVDILNRIGEIEDIVIGLKNSINSVVVEQKEIEKTQLVMAIKEKIKSEEELKKHIMQNEFIRSNISDRGSNPQDIIFIIDDRLNKLYGKLEKALSL